MSRGPLRVGGIYVKRSSRRGGFETNIKECRSIGGDSPERQAEFVNCKSGSDKQRSEKHGLGYNHGGE